jgi:hypothetical protein
MSVFIDLAGLANGTYTIEDDGTPGNNTSIVRGPGGNVVTTFVHPADDLTILCRPNQSIIVNFTDLLGTANMTIGNVFSTVQSPDSIQVGSVLTNGAVTLSTRGAISELGSDADLDIVAFGGLFMRASTGIGAGNTLEIFASRLEADSNTGGINLSNGTSVVIGGVANGIRGLFTGTSGNITLVNQGSITFVDDTDGVENVHSANNVLLNAIGAGADISSSVNRPAIFAAGNIFMTAGRDVAFGTGGTDFNSAVRAGGSIFVTAGRDFRLDGSTIMSADDFGPATNGSITINAGRNIYVDDDFHPGPAGGAWLLIAATGSIGSINLTTGIGGTLVVGAPFNAPGYYSITTGSAGGLGSVNIHADFMTVEPDSGIAANSISIDTVSFGRRINLGARSPGPESLNALELGYQEIGLLTTPNLRIGGPFVGDVNVVFPFGDFARPAMTLQSGADINLGPSFLVTANSLTFIAAENINQDPGSVLQSASVTFAVDTPDSDPQGGLLNLLGTVTAATQTLNGNADADTLIGNGSANRIFGFAGNDALNGLAGADILDGGPGADILFGGTQDDVFVVDNANDQVIEAVNEGFDTIFASVNYRAPANIERIGVNGVTTTFAINLTGNGLNNEVIGNDGPNLLDGDSGADTMTGLGGDDIYVVDSAGDMVNEAAGGGFDTVFTMINYTLGANVERAGAMIPAGTTPLVLIGNALANEISGNDGANTINGGGGPDILIGRGGGDAFFFTTTLGGGNVDQIPDFQAGLDKMALDDAVFAGLATGALAAGAFRAGTSAQDADDRIIYDPATGALYFDADGAGGAAQVQFANVSSGLGLGAGDFVVV